MSPTYYSITHKSQQLYPYKWFWGSTSNHRCSVNCTYCGRLLIAYTYGKIRMEVMRGRETREINDLQLPGLGVYVGKVHLLESFREVASYKLMAGQRGEKLARF